MGMTDVACLTVGTALPTVTASASCLRAVTSLHAPTTSIGLPAPSRAAGNSCCAGHPLRGPNWLLGGGFCRSRCWLGYHYRIGNRLRNIDRFRARVDGHESRATSLIEQAGLP